MLDAAEAAKGADTLVLAVKPQDMGTLLDEIAPRRAAADQLVISVAAGITTAFIERRLAEGVPVVRVMSNTPGAGRRGDERRSRPGAARAPRSTCAGPRSCCRPVGKVLRIPESQQDAVTALSGSGPAYFYFLVEAMIDAGILLGLPRADRR